MSKTARKRGGLVADKVVKGLRELRDKLASGKPVEVTSLRVARRKGKLVGSPSRPTMTPFEHKPVTKRTYTGKLARRLRQLRTDKGISAAKLADKIGVSKVTIYKWESAENQIDADKYPAIAKALGVTAAEFFPEF